MNRKVLVSSSNALGTAGLLVGLGRFVLSPLQRALAPLPLEGSQEKVSVFPARRAA